MEVEAIFPEHRVEPWHAMFVLDEDVLLWPEVFKKANKYGKNIVGMGLASKYFVLCGEDHRLHIIPTFDESKHILDYWHEIFDKNT